MRRLLDGPALRRERLLLNPRISLREESFGALCYNFSTRELFLVKSRLVLKLAELARCGVDRSVAEATLGASPEGFDRLVEALLARKVLLLEEAPGGHRDE